jgi:hypothetical protein
VHLVGVPALLFGNAESEKQIFLKGRTSGAFRAQAGARS